MLSVMCVRFLFCFVLSSEIVRQLDLFSEGPFQLKDSILYLKDFPELF